MAKKRDKARRMAELNKQILGLREELYRLEHGGEDEQRAALVGKCFKCRNCYSCPDSDSDYWWLYLRVVSVENEALRTISFQDDKYGDIRIKTNETHVLGSLVDGSYIEIPLVEFVMAWVELSKRMALLPLG